ncbi:MAG: hypothetical protein J6T13_06545 [Bacteroidales bacterium]|nr:hypothetical protein [Bacteroidales bacterium]
MMKSTFAQNKAAKWILLLLWGVFCCEIQAQPTRTEFVNKAPYPQYSSTEFTCSAKDISLNGWVKSVQQTSTIRRFTQMPSGKIIFCVKQHLYAFDSTGNLTKYIDKELCSKDTDIVFSDSEIPSSEYLKAKHFKIDEEETCSFQAGLLISKKSTNPVANSTTHYEYNEQGQLIRETSYYGIMPRITSISLNENGQPLSVSIITHSSNTDSQNKGKRQKQGNKTDDNVTDLFCYDEHGNCVAHLEKIREEWRMDFFEYDDVGNLIFEGRCEEFNEKKPCICQKKHINHGYEYDGNRRMTRNYLIGNWKPNGWDYYYQYDSAGREIEYTKYETRGDERTFTTHVISSYDSLGRIVRKEALRGTFLINEAIFSYSNVVMQQWEYDAYGNILWIKAYFSKDKPFKVVKYEYEYDDHGNWTKRYRHEGNSEDAMTITETLEREISYY